MLNTIILYQHLFEFCFIFGGMITLLKIEAAFTQKTKENKFIRQRTNISLAFFALGCSFFLARYVDGIVGQLIKFIPVQILILSQKESQITFLNVLLSIIALDFFQYCVHRASHKIPLLWRFHAVHHSDSILDVTTAYRHHPFELVFITFLFVPVFLCLFFIFHLPLLATVIFSGLNIFISLTSHSNIRLPQNIDSFLRFWLVTPSFHRVHHMRNRKYTDSNYGAIFPWFDYLFHTATKIKHVEISSQEIGLGISRSQALNKIYPLLIFPFQFRYWVKKAKKKTKSS